MPASVRYDPGRGSPGGVAWWAFGQGGSAIDRQGTHGPASPSARPVSGRIVAAALLVAVFVAFGVLPAAGAGPSARVVAGARSSGAVALTFDDGYDRAACGRIARTLRAHHARGTFFLNGVNLRKAPDAWRRVLKGQAVGNHTWSHPDLTHLGEAAIRAQIVHNETVHERILGRPMLRVLRPPYGAEDGRVRSIAGQLGYRRTVIWNVDTLDWRSSATVGSIVNRAIGAPPGSIILMHCGPLETPRALPAIIRHYQARGIELTGLGRVLRP